MFTPSKCLNFSILCKVYSQVCLFITQKVWRTKRWIATCYSSRMLCSCCNLHNFNSIKTWNFLQKRFRRIYLQLLLLGLFIKGVTKLENFAIDCSTKSMSRGMSSMSYQKLTHASKQKLPVSNKAWLHPKATSLKNWDEGKHWGAWTSGLPQKPLPQLNICPLAG